MNLEEKEYPKVEIQNIRNQLDFYVPNSPIEELAMGFVEEIEDCGEIKLESKEGEISTYYVSKEFLEERRLNQSDSKFFALVEYQSIHGRRIDIVRLIKYNG